MNLRGTWVALFVTLAACSKDSSDVTSTNIEAQFSVTYNTIDKAKPTTDIRVKLTDASASTLTPVNLGASDTLSLTTDKNDNLPLPRTGDGDYDATIQNVAASVFTFHLKRSSSTIDSVLTMPAPLALTAPTPNQTYAIGDKVHFEWTNKAKRGTVYVSGSAYPCGGAAINLSGKNPQKFDDTGSFDVALADLYSAGSPASGDCIDLTIERDTIDDAAPGLSPSSGVYATRTDPAFTIKVK